MRWAAEIYGDWATWMNYIFPECQTGYKKSTLRIVNKIKEMRSKENIQQGWK